MLTELRRYAVLPGEMDQMHARMSGMLLPLFAEHDIPRPRAIWENRKDAWTLTWMVDWPDFETRLQAWTAFAPVFVAARAAEGTPEFVTRTTLTVIAPWPGAALGFAPGAACESAWLVQPRIGHGAGFMAACQAEAFDRFRAAGAVSVNACNFLFGPLPQAMVLIGWPDAATRAAGLAAIAEAPLGDVLATALLGDGDRFGDRGEWETLDRAPYLAS